MQAATANGAEVRQMAEKMYRKAQIENPGASDSQIRAAVAKKMRELGYDL